MRRCRWGCALGIVKSRVSPVIGEVFMFIRYESAPMGEAHEDVGAGGDGYCEFNSVKKCC